MQAGKYKARAADVGLGMTQTGKEEVAILFRITEGELEGQVITWHGFFTDGTTTRTIESLRNCGWQGDDLGVFCTENHPSAEALLPYDVEIDVKPNEYNGEIRMQVAWVNRPGSGGVALKTKLDPQQSKAFAARMKGACKVVPVVKAPATPVNNKPMRQPGEDMEDDFPPGL